MRLLLALGVLRMRSNRPSHCQKKKKVAVATRGGMPSGSQPGDCTVRGNQVGLQWVLLVSCITESDGGLRTFECM